jgi:hypothetical protein
MTSEFFEQPFSDSDPVALRRWILGELQWLIHQLNDVWAVDASSNIIIPADEWERADEIICWVADHFESELAEFEQRGNQGNGGRHE